MSDLKKNLQVQIFRWCYICTIFQTVPCSSKSSIGGDKVASTDRRTGWYQYIPLNFVCGGIKRKWATRMGGKWGMGQKIFSVESDGCCWCCNRFSDTYWRRILQHYIGNLPGKDGLGLLSQHLQADGTYNILIAEDMPNTVGQEISVLETPLWRSYCFLVL